MRRGVSARLRPLGRRGERPGQAGLGSPRPAPLGGGKSSALNPRCRAGIGSPCSLSPGAGPRARTPPAPVGKGGKGKVRSGGAPRGIGSRVRGEGVLSPLQGTRAGRGCLPACLSVCPSMLPPCLLRTELSQGPWGAQVGSHGLAALPGAVRALFFMKSSGTGTPQPPWGVCGPRGGWEHPLLGLAGLG